MQFLRGLLSRLFSVCGSVVFCGLLNPMMLITDVVNNCTGLTTLHARNALSASPCRTTFCLFCAIWIFGALRWVVKAPGCSRGQSRWYFRTTTSTFYLFCALKILWALRWVVKALRCFHSQCRRFMFFWSNRRIHWYVTTVGLRIYSKHKFE